MILVVNAGSTSLKLSLVDEHGSATKVGSFEEIDAALEGVAHRVVHGGQRFIEPVVVDGAVEREIIQLETIAPLHNGPALEGLTRAREAFPDVPHIAVFDTAFHHTIPAEAFTYALPAEWREWGIRRFGFHGLSVEWSTQRAAELLGRDAGTRLVVCHLGGGCSVTAVRDGRSVDTTMGFSPLEGIPMTTRSGSIDPAIVFYVMRVHGLTADAAEHALNFESGIEGLAPGHGGTRAVERAAAAGDEPAGSPSVCSFTDLRRRSRRWPPRRAESMPWYSPAASASTRRRSAPPAVRASAFWDSRSIRRQRVADARLRCGCFRIGGPDPSDRCARGRRCCARCACVLRTG